jgi:sugar phosphate isomerase/epimerase
MELSRISACTYPIRTEPLDHIFSVFSTAGYKKLDLWGGPPNYASDPSECDIDAMRELAESYGLLIANLGTYGGRTLADNGLDAELAILQHDIDNAVALGSRSIRVSPGHGEDADVEELIPLFSQAAEYAAEKGIYLGMENHNGSIACDPDAVMPLVEAVDSPYFGILYEPANLMACRVPYKEAYKAFRGHVVHAHVKDSRWIGDTYERTMLGEGDVDIRWVVETLEADGYDGDYALEFEIEKKVPIEQGLPTWLEYFQRIE